MCRPYSHNDLLQPAPIKLNRFLQIITNFLLTTTTTTVLQPFFWDHPDETVPEENLWTLWCKGRLTEADTPTIQLGATPSGLTSAHIHHHPLFYRPDALPAAQPTVSNHLRLCQSTEGLQFSCLLQDKNWVTGLLARK